MRRNPLRRSKTKSVAARTWLARTVRAVRRKFMRAGKRKKLG
jgi:hypothetical protein